MHAACDLCKTALSSVKNNCNVCLGLFLKSRRALWGVLELLSVVLTITFAAVCLPLAIESHIRLLPHCFVAIRHVLAPVGCIPQAVSSGFPIERTGLGSFRESPQAVT